MANIVDFKVTNHAFDRLVDRCPEFQKIVKMISTPALKKKASYDFVKNFIEEKSFTNNTIFMNYLYSRYGYDKTYNFFIKDNIILVGISYSGGKYIVTILEKNKHLVHHLKNTTQKFKKKPEQINIDITPTPIPRRLRHIHSA